MRRSKRKGTEKNMDEVEQLLQSVQDQLLLNISVNSHIAHASASNSVSPLDSDLDCRFQALKSSQLSNSITSAAANQDQELKEVLGDDLSSRFAALKAKSVPNPNSLTSSISAAAIIEEAPLLNDEDEEEEDEVDKLIRWAKDATCLDPSPRPKMMKTAIASVTTMSRKAGAKDPRAEQIYLGFLKKIGDEDGYTRELMQRGVSEKENG